MRMLFTCPACDTGHIEQFKDAAVLSCKECGQPIKVDLVQMQEEPTLSVLDSVSIYANAGITHTCADVGMRYPGYS